jgi:enamine deaminase RidA (YjgF/YER057c/UK114 family)
MSACGWNISPRCRPAPTVEVRRLSHPDFLVEVEAIAVVENK